MTHKIITLFLFLVSGSLLAQTDFKPGFIIKTDGDTVFGKIDYRGDKTMGQLCRFKSVDNAITDFYPADLKAFRFTDSKYFISKKINERPEFLEYLFNGIVNLYYLRNESGDHYYIDRDTIPLKELWYKEDVISRNGVRYRYESKDFIGQLDSCMKDAPGIAKKIGRIDKPEHRILISLAYDYHTQICKDRSCIIYEKQLPMFRISVEPSAGISWFKDLNQTPPEYGAYLYFQAPRTNEKIYLKSGVFSSTLTDHDYFLPESDGEKISVTRIPLQILYMPDTRFINPTFSFGYNILKFKSADYKDLMVFPCLNAGVVFKISGSFRVGINVNTLYSPLFSVFEGSFSMISASCDIGLIIKI